MRFSLYISVCVCVCVCVCVRLGWQHRDPRGHEYVMRRWKVELLYVSIMQCDRGWNFRVFGSNVRTTRFPRCPLRRDVSMWNYGIRNFRVFGIRSSISLISIFWFRRGVSMWNYSIRNFWVFGPRFHWFRYPLRRDLHIWNYCINIIVIL